MSTTVLQTHRRLSLNRGSLGHSPPSMNADDTSDASTSPHVNTLRNAKTESSQKLTVSSSSDEKNMRTASSADTTVEPTAVADQNDETNDNEDLPPAPCHGSPQKNEDNGNERNGETADDSPSPTDGSNLHGQNGRPPTFPAENAPSLNANSSMDSRIPSSSIPHLLSASYSSEKQNQAEMAPGGAQVIHHQLSFLGLEAALPSAACEGETSFTFSADDDDKEISKNNSSPNNTCITPLYNEGLLNYAAPNMLFQATQILPQSHNNLMSQDGKLQYNSSTSRDSTTSPQNMSSYMTPPHVIGFTANSPPYKVAAMNAQSMQLTLERQLSETKLMPPNTSSPEKKIDTGCISNESSRDDSNSGVNNPIVKNDTSSSGWITNDTSVLTAVPLQQQQMQPYQSNYRHQKASVVRPVLYSAINSLERYNAGSFDNKVFMAKAYGKMGNRKAFPGVPSKNRTDGRMGSNSVDSDIGSKASSVSSALSTDFAGRRKESVGSIGDCSQSQSTMSGTRELTGLGIMPSESSEGGSQNVQRIENEQVIPILNNKSNKKMARAKSSGNLSESAERDSDHFAQSKTRGRRSKNRGVTIDDKYSSKKGKRREKTVGVFRPSCDAYTPRMGNRAIKYKTAEERPSVEKMSSTMGTIQRPNFRDALRRVAIILHQHIVKIERRFETGMRGIDDTGLFKSSMRDYFSEDNFATPRFKCSMVRVPMARPGVVYSMRKIRVVYNTPTTDEIYEFAHQLFKKVQLSSECSIVCLIYVEKLMEVAKVPLVSNTWRPIFMCGLLLASKVWQDLSSWNIEFASVYPQFSLDAINRLELQFLKCIKWDLYISSSLYAKYYFALRSLLEKSGFRDRYNQMVGGIGGIAASEAIKISKRSEAVKEEALLQLSRSM